VPASSAVPFSRWSNAPARVSIGRCFLNLRNSRAKPVGLRLLSLRKRTKVVDPHFLHLFLFTGCVGWGGQVKISKWHLLETHFGGKWWHHFEPENTLAPFSGGLSNTTFFEQKQNPVGLRFLNSKKPGKSGRSDVLLD